MCNFLKGMGFGEIVNFDGLSQYWTHDGLQAVTLEETQVTENREALPHPEEMR